MRLGFRRLPATTQNPVHSGWRRSAFALVLCGIGACAGVSTAAALIVLHLRAIAIDDRISELSNAAKMLSAHADSALQALESVETGVIDQMRGSGITTEERYITLMKTVEVQQNLKDRISALPFADAVTLIDRDGNLLNFTRSWPIPKINVADRGYFKELSSGRQSGRVVTEPVQNRASGGWTFFIARRFEAPDGSFLGVVLGAVELDYFQRFFAEIAPEKDAVIVLLRTDGVMLVRQPAAEQAIGRTLPSGTMHFLMGGMRQGTTRSVSPIDGQDRIVSIHDLAHYPIVVSKSRSVAATLARWQQQMHWFVGITAVVDLGIGGLVLLGIRHLRSRDLLTEALASRAEAQMERAASEERERNGRTLAVYYSRFDTAVSNMSQGLCMFDANDRLIISNPRLAEIFDLPAAVLEPGTTLAVAARAAVRGRSTSAGDIRFVRARFGLASSDARRGALVWDLIDGRALSISFEHMDEQGWLMTFEDITERRRTEAKIAHMAHHDALTGLPNRILFHERLVAAVALAGRGGQYGIICLDLDHFKDVNDTLGHPVGDALLRAVTARLLRCVRETDSIARLGGDEFAIIMGLVQHPREMAALAERIIEEVSLPYELLGHQVVIGVSIGIAITPDDGADPDALLKNADLALYRAKAEGRGCHRFFKPEMDATLQARRRLELDLRRAFAQREFQLHYQPLMNLRARRVSGFEALLRWECPGRPDIGPQQFVPIAEEIGLIIPIGEWALETACMDAAGWAEHITIAVNLSPVQFRSRNLINAVRGALERSGLSAGRLEVEITETILLNDTTDTLATLHQLRDLGVRISMDDFGTGYSSLSYLLKFPFDKVKIDQSFVRGLGGNPDCNAIIRAVTGMCHDLGMATIAEGVETQEQLDVLQARDCKEVQGFLFSAAVPAADVKALIDSFEPGQPRPGSAAMMEAQAG